MTGSSARFVIATLVMILVLAGLGIITRPDPSVRNMEIFTEMAYSLAAESYTPHDAFQDGRTMQHLVAGVVPRGTRPFRYGTDAAEAERAGRELVNPLDADDAEALQRGAELFRITCLVCHDARGTGRGPAVLRGMLPPPSIHGARAAEMPDGQMFHVITRGQGNMASHAAQLTVKERWQVIRHVRQLQEQGP